MFETVECSYLPLPCALLFQNTFRTRCQLSVSTFMYLYSYCGPFCTEMMEPALVAQLDALSDWRPGGRGFNPRRGRQHSFVEIDHEIFSTVILSLPLIQEGQLSVSGKRMCSILVNRLEDWACPVNVWLGKLTALEITPLGWLGRKTSTQTEMMEYGECPKIQKFLIKWRMQTVQISLLLNPKCME